MKKILSRWLPCATLAAWGVLVLYFYSGRHHRIDAYLHPTFRPYTLIAGIVMLTLALCFVLYPINTDACAQNEITSRSFRRKTSGRILAFFLLLVPICASALVSKDSYSANMFKNSAAMTVLPPARAKAAAPAAVPGPAAANSYSEPPLPSKNPQDAQAQQAQSQPPPADDAQEIPRSKDGNMIVQVVDLLYAAQDSTLQPDFKGQTVEMIGQLMPDTTDNPNGDRFKLVRMFIVCCAADARPVAVLVQSDKKPTGAEMSWIKVVGTVEFPVEGGRTIAVVKATKVDQTTPPEETMLY